VAWQKARDLAVVVYRLTAGFPDDERFGLTSQMRRATVSISSNIAEGWGRHSRTDYVRFLKVARGSAYEVRSQMHVASELGFMTREDEAWDAIAEVERLVNGLINSIERTAR